MLSNKSVDCRAILAKVVGVFSVSGRGLVLLPEKPTGDFKVRNGLRIQLRKPDGVRVDTHMRSVEMACGLDGCHLAIALPSNIAKDIIPHRTEIWYVPQNTGQDGGDAPTAPAS